MIYVKKNFLIALIAAAAFFTHAQEDSAFVRDPKAFYMIETESIDGSEVNIMASKLRSVMSKEGYRFTDNPRIVGHLLQLEAKSCNASEIEGVFYCQVCVKVEIIDMKTDKTVGTIDFAGPKTGWKEQKNACVKSFERAVDATWKKMKEDIKIFR